MYTVSDKPSGVVCFCTAQAVLTWNYGVIAGRETVMMMMMMMLINLRWKINENVGPYIYARTYVKSCACESHTWHKRKWHNILWTLLKNKSSRSVYKQTINQYEAQELVYRMCAYKIHWYPSIKVRKSWRSMTILVTSSADIRRTSTCSMSDRNFSHFSLKDKLRH